MSARALRKLHGQGDLPDVGPLDEEDVDEQEETYPCSSQSLKKNKKKKNKVQVPENPFDLLNDGDEAVDDEAEANQDDSPNEEVIANGVENLQPAKAKKKKKKKKKRDQEKEAPCDVDKDEDEIDASVREVNQLLGELPVREQSSNDAGSYDSRLNNSLLAVERKNLNADNEMKRIFGSQVVQSETRQRRGRGRTLPKTWWLAQPKDTWPPIAKTGLNMAFLHTRDGQNHFTFEHSQQYRQIQFQFLDAVESLNPENLTAVLQLQAYHIDTLLQLSEVCKMGEDIQMATTLIERALYSFEVSFHPMFNLAQGNCRLDYRRSENRAFYIALFRHLQFVGQKGCNRTALEFCKVLLSLDPDTDPLGVLLMIDYYALRSEQFSFLVRTYSDLESSRNLQQLPNFAFSVALAKFHLSQQENTSVESADNMLQLALLMYPSALIPLLDKLGIEPDAQVRSHSYFSPSLQKCGGLEQLVALYVGRSHPCWKEPEVVSWLERNVRETLQRVDQEDPLVKEFEERRKIRYQGMPRNIQRHILMSEIREAMAALPPEMANTPVMSYDPIPPADAIESYSRPQRRRVIDQDSNTLSMFFRSLLPNFNPNEVADEAAGAAGGQDLRQGVGALMDAMRDLLNNIQPVAPPVENEENQHQADQDGVPPGEWD